MTGAGTGGRCERLLLSDVVDIRGTGRGTSFGQVQLEYDKSYVDATRTRAFPENTELRTVLTSSGNPLHAVLRAGSPDSRCITFE
jgi:hypothetical protein